MKHRALLAILSFALPKFVDFRRFSADTKMQLRLSPAPPASKVETTWRRRDEIDVATVEIDEWKGVEKIAVPFEVRVSVGLNTAEER